MFPDPPEPPQLVQMAAQGPWGGPSYAYRGAKIQLRMAPTAQANRLSLSCCNPTSASRRST
jgi:hypothetical protein